MGRPYGFSRGRDGDLRVRLDEVERLMLVSLADQMIAFVAPPAHPAHQAAEAEAAATDSQTKPSALIAPHDAVPDDRRPEDAISTRDDRIEATMTPGPWKAKGCSFSSPHGVQGSGIMNRATKPGGTVGFASGFQDGCTEDDYSAAIANAAGIVHMRNRWRARTAATWQEHERDKDAEVAAAQADTREACAALVAIGKAAGIELPFGSTFCAETARLVTERIAALVAALDEAAGIIANSAGVDEATVARLTAVAHPTEGDPAP